MNKVKKAILVVDDSRDQITLIKVILNKYSLDIFEASTYGEALEIHTHNKLDLIISDYEMPGENGLELLKAIRKSSSIKFILMTGKPDFMSSVAYQQGVSEVIFKPYRVNFFIQILEAHLGILEASF